MKTCFKCEATKPYSEFYRHGQMGDGYLGKCKDCTRSDVRAHREANIERYREQERERGREAEKIASSVRTTRAWRQKHPDRHIAHGRALRAHRLAPELCERCKQPKRLERHHPDYSQPLLVEWLCKPCHYRADVERRASEVA